MLRPALALLLSVSLPAQGTLIPVPARRDHVFDASRNLLYVTTSSGTVERYDVIGERLLAPIAVSAELWGGDITPDDAALYVCDDAVSPTQGFVQRIDLATGAVTALPFDFAGSDSHAWDLVIAANGRAFFTANFFGSGWVPVREIDLATGAIRPRNDALGSFGALVRNRTRFERGATRGLLLVLEADSSAGPMFFYDAASDSFHAGVRLNQFFDFVPAAIAGDDSLLAFRRLATIDVVDRALDAVASLPAWDGGLLFDPARARLYAVDTAGQRVLAYRTTDWSLAGEWPIGEVLERYAQFGDGMMSMSPDGALLFLSTRSGVRMLRLGKLAPEVAAVEPPRGAFDAAPALVIVRGAAFRRGEVPQVRFGGALASSVAVIDDATLVCVPPPGLPGPVDVAVRNDNGEGVLARGFSYTPALRLAGSPAPGESFTVRAELPPQQRALLLFLGLPPRVAIPTPPFGGLLQIGAPLLLLAQPFVLPRDVTIAIRVPDDPALEGAELLWQALIGEPAAATGAWSNAELLRIGLRGVR
jgi:hypothetical protein